MASSPGDTWKIKQLLTVVHLEVFPTDTVFLQTCIESLTIGSVGAVLPSHHYHFYTKKSAANAHTTNCKRSFTYRYVYVKDLGSLDI